MIDDWLKEVFKQDDEFNAEMQRREYEFERKYGPLRMAARVKEEQQQDLDRRVGDIERRFDNLEKRLNRAFSNTRKMFDMAAKAIADRGSDIAKLKKDRSAISEAIQFLTSREFVPVSSTDDARTLRERLDRLEKMLTEVELVQTAEKFERSATIHELPNPLRFKNAG
jgi:hypothetical protein